MEHTRRVVPEPFDDVGELPKIFVFINGRYTGGSFKGHVLPVALAEDGTALAEHLCSSEAWAFHDMGLTSEWKHDAYLRHYPRGFELVWIEDIHSDPRVALALERNKTNAAKGDPDA